MRDISGTLRRSPVAQFALSGLLATLLISVVAVAVIRNIGRQEAIRDAKQVTQLAGQGVVEPYLTTALVAGDRGARARLDAIVRARVLRGSIVRVKIWTSDGRIVYSDEPGLIGKRYTLRRDEQAALARGRVEAEISDLSRPENRFERGGHKLLEVYLPVRDASGSRMLFEAYQRYSSVAASGRRLWLAMAPAILGGLLLLWLVNLPLARSLARRLRQGQRQREELLRRSLDASQTERRRIAADLHDGVVQDLVGVSYSLSAKAQQLNGAGDGVAKGALSEGAAETRNSVRALRTLLVDIYPPSLHRAGLLATLADLARTHSGRGLHTELDVPDELEVSEHTEELLFRCAQEALRNAAQHASAKRVAVAVRQEGDTVELSVRDDGVGFVASVIADRPAQGHFGLSMLADLVREAGGTLDVRPTPGQGTTIDCRLPTR